MMRILELSDKFFKSALPTRGKYYRLTLKERGKKVGKRNLKIPLILCLGNEILSDDGFGAEVARLLAQDVSVTEAADVIFAPLAGFALLDLLVGRPRALIVDTIRTGTAKPGTLHRFPAAELAVTNHLTTSHQLSLPAAMELGRRLKWNIPDDIEVLAVEAQELERFEERLSEPVQAAVSEAVRIVKDWTSQKTKG